MADNVNDQKLESLIIITSTLYKKDEVSEVRSLIALETLRRINDLGVRCVVVDGGSDTHFLENAGSLPNITVVVEPRLGMGESRRKALDIAVTQFPDSKFYLWMEPEKDDLVREDSLEAMLGPLEREESDIVVPKRKSLAGYPKFQKWIEQRANKRVANQLNIYDDEGQQLDLWFGPKMFNRCGAEYFLNYQSSLDKWDSIIAPVVEGHRKGARIKSVVIDYRYDTIQELHEEEDSEMNRKRIEQYTTILPELGDKYWQQKTGEHKNG